MRLEPNHLLSVDQGVTSYTGVIAYIVGFKVPRAIGRRRHQRSQRRPQEADIKLLFWHRKSDCCHPQYEIVILKEDKNINFT
jgi:hypothetical protein